MTSLPPESYQSLLRQALAEDIGTGDVTTRAVVSPDCQLSARLMSREPLVPAGLDIAQAAFKLVDKRIELEAVGKDGLAVQQGEVLMTLNGPAAGILTAERVALNFLQHLSGVATLTGLFVERVHGTGAEILDTRKTTPGWRVLEKYAVRCGGGRNHRVGLFDMVLIKDNHLAALKSTAPNPVQTAVEEARRQHPSLRLEVEADSLEQVEAAVRAGADLVLLDNMTLEQLKAAVALTQGKCQTEASGGVTLDTVRGIAETGVDFISVGALTHSARAVDIGLDVVIP